jgi:hypothetical protein
MRYQQFESELKALDQSLERLYEKLDFRLVRIEELIPRRLRHCLAKGVPLAAVVLRRTPSVQHTAEPPG